MFFPEEITTRDHHFQPFTVMLLIICKCTLWMKAFPLGQVYGGNYQFRCIGFKYECM